MNPTVSVLIPTYNYGRYLPEAIDSVLEQDLDDFELIIADDASTDQTPELCRRYAEQDSRIRFVQHEKNLGMVENWNWCLRQARGKYIKYMLADDKFNRPYALRRMVDALEKKPSATLVVSSRLIVDEKSQPMDIWNPLGSKQDKVFAGEKLMLRCLRKDRNMIGEPTAALFRRRDALRGFDEGFRQLVDLEMWCHLLKQGDLVYLSDPLCCFRRHPEQQTEVNRERGLHQYEAIALYDRYMGYSSCKRVLFRYIYKLEKLNQPEYQTLISTNKARFSPVEYRLRYVTYKLGRPFLNVYRSFLKRVRQKRVHFGF